MMHFVAQRTSDLITSPLPIQINMAFQRRPEDASKEPLTHSGERFITVPPGAQMRNELIALLESNNPNAIVHITNAFPLFIVVPNEGQVHPANTLLNSTFFVASLL